MSRNGNDRHGAARARRGALAACAASLTALVGLDAAAGVVHIQVERRSGTEFGAGYTVGRDADCFVVTPLHVVDLAGPDGITVTDSEGRSAKARLVKGVPDFDAALLRITESVALDCPADWSDGAAAGEAVDEAPFVIAHKIDDAGRTMRTRFFVSSSTREEMEVQPYRTEDELREGDSGSALFAGDELVGMITAVDTRTGSARALTQGQIHGLFGGDVLPDALSRVLVAAFRYRNAEHAYASAAAREYLAESGRMQVLSLPAGSTPDTLGADYVISGQVLQVTATQIENPDYEPPERADSSGAIGRRLLQSLQDRARDEVNDALDRNQEARYLRKYQVDVQVEVHDLAENLQFQSLEQLSFEYPVLSGNGSELENTAIGDAVRGALGSTLEQYGIGGG